MSSLFETALQKKVAFILAPDRIEEWQILRDSFQDQSLADAHRDIFVANIRAAYLQLLGGAMMKALGGPAAVMRDSGRAIRAYQICAGALAGQDEDGTIEELKCVYNKAYGSSPSNANSAMADVFNHLVARGKMSSRAQNNLAEHFAAIWMSMISELNRVVSE